MALLSPPEENAAPDDQGDLGFCSRFALAKTVGNGFMEKKFSPFQQLDFLQSDISTALVNIDKVLCCIISGTYHIYSHCRHKQQDGHPSLRIIHFD